MSYPSWNTSMKTLHFDYSCLYQSLRNFQLLQSVQLLIKNRTNDEDPLFLNSSQAAGKAPCASPITFTQTHSAIYPKSLPPYASPEA